MNNTKEKSKQMFGWLEKSTSGLKSKLLKVLFPNEHGGTNYYQYRHRVYMFINKIKWWCKLSKVFLKFWKIPFAIQDLEQVGEDALRASSQANEEIDTLNSTIDALIERIVERRYDQTPIAAGMSEDDHYKKCYREVFKECCSDYDDDIENSLAFASIGNVRLQLKYMNEDEFELRFDKDYEQWRENMDPYNATHHSEACYLMNDLKKRGFYDN